MKKFGTYILIFIIVLASAILVLRLFFEETYNDYVLKHFQDAETEEAKNIDELRFVGLFETENFDLHTLDPFMRFPVSQIYEPLLHVDDSLGVTPALALSWGEIDENVWQFKLRKGVKFHDGSEFDADDLVKSLEDAVADKGTDLAKLLSFVDSVEKVDAHKVKIFLKNDDPLALVKLSYLLIESSEDSETPIGTAEFKFEKSDDEVVFFSKFEDYWGKKSLVKALKLINEDDADERLKLLVNSKADIASALPLSAGDELNNNFEIIAIPRLEMSFLVFNSSSKVFKGDELKNALNLAIDRAAMINLLDDAVVPLYQFAPRGVIGKNPEIKAKKVDLFRASEILEEKYPNELIKLTLHYLEGNSIIVNHLKAHLKPLGIELKIEELKWEQMQESLKSGKADLYLLTWKFDVPDISEFLKVFVHSFKVGNTGFGVLNMRNYLNQDADSLIKKALLENDFEQKNKILKELMAIIIKEDPFGIPLFEAASIYAYRSHLNVEPRLDGSISLKDVTIK